MSFHHVPDLISRRTVGPTCSRRGACWGTVAVTDGLGCHGNPGDGDVSLFHIEPAELDHLTMTEQILLH